MTAVQQVFAWRFSLNKRRNVRRFLGDCVVKSVRHPRQLAPGSILLIWGSTPAPEGLDAGVTLIRVEDGFLRSVGLGAELARPLSLVMDSRGIYYDATCVSDLERLLQTVAFGGATLERAARLRRRIVAAGLTKYNVGRGQWQRPATSQRVVLVAGQVETDASLRLGSPVIRSNVGLLRLTREAEPDAYIVYKPHPDVTAGVRAAGADEHAARYWCDEVVTDVPIDSLLSTVDAVHVLTSLAGFEALLREKQVVCHGLPFYAGWGLTRDALKVERRTRRLTLDELVAGALIAYPRYISRSGGECISPEQAVTELLALRARASARIRPWRYLWRPLLRAAESRK